jgi:hypothetical protein
MTSQVRKGELAMLEVRKLPMPDGNALAYGRFYPDI